ncbi:hypothetical protein KKB44_04595 [Candidatus Micrarchaeota archaeon]|nr:hypothetical protein [Candidatus Micrarchaeota archaeon]
MQKLQLTKFYFADRPVFIGALRRFADKNCVPLLETPLLLKRFNEEHGTNLTLLDPHIADFLINRTLKWVDVREAFPSPIGMAIGYEKPGKKLGAEIVHTSEEMPRAILPTGRYKCEKGIALVVTNLTADDIKKDGKDVRIDVPDDRLIVVPSFPSVSGYYVPHHVTTIPHAEKAESICGGRYLGRLNSSYVGMPVYDYYLLNGGAVKCLSAVYPPFNSTGLLVQIQETDIHHFCASESPYRKTPDSVVVEMLGISKDQLSELLAAADKAATGMRIIVGTKIDPVMRILQILRDSLARD